MQQSRDLSSLVKQVKAILPEYSDDQVCEALLSAEEDVEQAMDLLLSRAPSSQDEQKKGDKKTKADAGEKGTGGSSSSSSGQKQEDQSESMNGLVDQVKRILPDLGDVVVRQALMDANKDVNNAVDRLLNCSFTSQSPTDQADTTDGSGGGSSSSSSSSSVAPAAGGKSGVLSDRVKQVKDVLPDLSDATILQALTDSNQDPNDAIERLLSTTSASSGSRDQTREPSEEPSSSAEDSVASLGSPRLEHSASEQLFGQRPASQHTETLRSARQMGPKTRAERALTKLMRKLKEIRTKILKAERKVREERRRRAEEELRREQTQVTERQTPRAAPAPEPVPAPTPAPPVATTTEPPALPTAPHPPVTTTTPPVVTTAAPPLVVTEQMPQQQFHHPVDVAQRLGNLGIVHTRTLRLVECF